MSPMPYAVATLTTRTPLSRPDRFETTPLDSVAHSLLHQSRWLARINARNPICPHTKRIAREMSRRARMVWGTNLHIGYTHTRGMPSWHICARFSDTAARGLHINSTHDVEGGERVCVCDDKTPRSLQKEKGGVQVIKIAKGYHISKCNEGSSSA